MPDRSAAASGRRPSVVIVAQAMPAQGGIPAFVDLLLHSPRLQADADLALLNTTRTAVREAGRLSVVNLWHALIDSVRVFRAARHSDVVHIQTAPGRVFPMARAVALTLAARLGGAATIVHVHSARINGGRFDGLYPGRAYRTLMRGLRAADSVITVSEPGANTIRRLVPAVRARAMDNAVEVASFSRSTPEKKPPTLLFLGTLSFRKGPADLAKALDLLRQRGVHDWQLRIVGGANEVGEGEAGQIRSLLDDAGLSDALVGNADAQGVREHLASSQVLVLPSHWEGQPIAILEAMAAGLPIVSTRVGAIPDVVRDGVDGLLVEPHDVNALADALERVIVDPALRASMGASAHARAVERYDIEVLSRNLGALYQELASARSR